MTAGWLAGWLAGWYDTVILRLTQFNCYCNCLLELSLAKLKVNDYNGRYLSPEPKLFPEDDELLFIFISNISDDDS